MDLHLDDATPEARGKVFAGVEGCRAVLEASITLRIASVSKHDLIVGTKSSKGPLGVDWGRATDGAVEDDRKTEGIAAVDVFEKGDFELCGLSDKDLAGDKVKVLWHRHAFVCRSRSRHATHSTLR